jgi:lipopolysaccharide/colanic/teichoic acid biosynthesis glycosyltransferase
MRKENVYWPPLGYFSEGIRTPMCRKVSRYAPVKRAIDVIISAISIIAFMPLMVILYLVILVRLGRPVLFRQARPGLNGEVFTLIKFRTMKNVNEKTGLVSDEQRLTSFGRYLRSTSLDELPTLFNVLKGDMSLVGPRPLLTKYLELYSPEEARRHEVRPGITGLAQVRGRNALSWEEKFLFDVHYVENCSFLLDCKVLFETISDCFRWLEVSSSITAGWLATHRPILCHFIIALLRRQD